MRAAIDETVMLLRTEYLQRAVQRVSQLAAHGDLIDALNASSELRRYFEWVKEVLPPAAKGVLFQQIQTLPKAHLNRR